MTRQAHHVGVNLIRQFIERFTVYKASEGPVHGRSGLSLDWKFFISKFGNKFGNTFITSRCGFALGSWCVWAKSFMGWDQFSGGRVALIGTVAWLVTNWRIQSRSLIDCIHSYYCNCNSALWPCTRQNDRDTNDRLPIQFPRSQHSHDSNGEPIAHRCTLWTER